VIASRKTQIVSLSIGAALILFSAGFVKKPVGSWPQEPKGETPQRASPSYQLSELMLREGFSALRSGRLAEAEYAAAVAHALGGRERVIALEAETDRMRFAFASLTEGKLADAISIGDVAREKKLKDALRLMRPSVNEGRERAGSPDGDSRLEEARLHAREGRFSQARASLEEAIERNPGDAGARSLLKELSMIPIWTRNAPPQPDDVEARRSFEEGMKLKVGGDCRAALRSLNRALRLSGISEVAPAFASAASQARSECEELLKSDYKAELKKIRKTLDETRGMEAEAERAKLFGAMNDVHMVVASSPDDVDARKLCEEIEAAAGAAAGRWLSSALAAERFSGCGRALPIYRKILADVPVILIEARAEAAGGVSRCDGQEDDG